MCTHRRTLCQDRGLLDVRRNPLLAEDGLSWTLIGYVSSDAGSMTDVVCDGISYGRRMKVLVCRIGVPSSPKMALVSVMVLRSSPTE